MQAQQFRALGGRNALPKGRAFMKHRDRTRLFPLLSIFSILLGAPAWATDPWAARPRESTVLSPRLAAEQPGTTGDVRKAWIYFTDKGITNAAEFGIAAARFTTALDGHGMTRRQKTMGSSLAGYHDLPLHRPYAEQVLALGAKKRAVSRYLNAISVEAPLPVLRSIAELPFVRAIEPVVAFSRRSVTPDPSRPVPAPRPGKRTYTRDYGPSLVQLEMMQVPALHDAGYDGAGMRIGLLDTGFLRTHEALQSVNVVGERDFINDDGNTAPEPEDPVGQHSHGTRILSLIAGYKPGQLIGPAFSAEYLLAKTEDTSQEVPIEEDYWVEGIEWADSMGADIVSSSLGYTDWYTYADMDGNTAVTTIAADLAAANGILVCASAGNEGDSDWRYVVAPADGDSMIATGAVWDDTTLVTFSSRGPTYDGRIKPDLVAQGVYVQSADPFDDHMYSWCHGTSCANPLLAGAAALVLEGNPFLTPYALIQALKTTATQATSPDTALGWGLIQAETASALVTSVQEATDLTRWGGKIPPAPKALILHASPNPFNPTVSLHVTLKVASELTLRVYDARGALVDSLLKERVEAGEHEVVWDGTNADGKDVPSGIYFAHAEAIGSSATEKISLVR
jgi:subtilisin family serine protease